MSSFYLEHSEFVPLQSVDRVGVKKLGFPTLQAHTGHMGQLTRKNMDVFKFFLLSTFECTGISKKTQFISVTCFFGNTVWTSERRGRATKRSISVLHFQSQPKNNQRILSPTLVHGSVSVASVCFVLLFFFGLNYISIYINMKYIVSWCIKYIRGSRHITSTFSFEVMCIKYLEVQVQSLCVSCC